MDGWIDRWMEDVGWVDGGWMDGQMGGCRMSRRTGDGWRM